MAPGLARHPGAIVDFGGYIHRRVGGLIEHECDGPADQHGNHRNGLPIQVADPQAPVQDRIAAKRHADELAAPPPAL